jgi:hypothetical protein
MKKKTILFCFKIFLIVFYASSLVAQNQLQIIGFHFTNNKVQKIKMKYKKANNLIVIPCFLNDQKDTLNFVLDTGVGNTLITDIELKKKLNLKCVREIKITAPNSLLQMNACVASVKNIAIGKQITSFTHNLVILEKDVLHLSEYAGMKIHGLIGADILSKFVVHINYIRNYLIFENPKNFKKPNSTYQSIKFSLEGQKPYIQTPIYLEKDTLCEGKFLIDTGAGHSLLLEKDTHKSIQLPSKTIETHLGVSLAGSIKGHIGRVKKIELGTFSFQNVITTFPDTISLSITKGLIYRNGNIGSGILKRFHLIFDYPTQTLWFKKNKDFKQKFELNTSGLEIIGLAPEYKTLVIGSVRKNSYAEKIGIEIGDEILFIDSYKISQLNIGQAYNLLNKKNKQKTIIIVKRKQEIRAFTIIAEEII